MSFSIENSLIPNKEYKLPSLNLLLIESICYLFHNNGTSSVSKFTKKKKGNKCFNSNKNNMGKSLKNYSTKSYCVKQKAMHNDSHIPHQVDNMCMLLKYYVEHRGMGHPSKQDQQKALF